MVEGLRSEAIDLGIRGLGLFRGLALEVSGLGLFRGLGLGFRA